MSLLMIGRAALRCASPLRYSSLCIATAYQGRLGPRSPLASASTPKPLNHMANGGAWRGPSSMRFFGGGEGLAAMIQQNQFASGGLALMAVGLTVHSARTVMEWALEWAKRRVFVSMELDSRDDAYRWVMAWLARHPEFRDSPRVSVTTSLQAFGTSGLEGSLVGSKKALLLPAPGDHVLKHQGRWVWISRKRTPGNPMASFSAKLLPETLVVTALGRDRSILEDILTTCADAYEADTRQRTQVFSMDAGSPYWTRVGSRPIRPLNTVVLPSNQAEILLADAKEFLSSEAWYAHHGIPYRRGYLLYGTPGSGKTSLVMALAGSLGLDVYVVTLSSPAMTDEVLRSLLNSAEERCLLLLEDVDSAFVGREGQEASSSLTFSGLLNAIDGVAAQEGRLLVMTTNHIERLSSALIRPGRVDVRCHIGYATREQVKRLFLSFYSTASPTGALASIDTCEGNEPGEAWPATHALPITLEALQQLAEEFASCVPEGRLSMAALQGFLMQHKRSAVSAREGIEAWLKVHLASQTKPTPAEESREAPGTSPPGAAPALPGISSPGSTSTSQLEGSGGGATPSDMLYG